MQFENMAGLGQGAMFSVERMDRDAFTHVD
jgi:hypothetical protein